MEDKVLERAERIAKIFNLVDGCKRCGLAFRVGSENTENAGLRHFSDQLRQTLDRFCFELLTEIRRMDHQKLVRRGVYVGAISNRDVLDGHGEAALTGLLHDYEQILTDHIPAHASAMIRRQAHLLKQMSERSSNLCHNASA
jgi:hypothetical protein